MLYVSLSDFGAGDEFDYLSKCCSLESEHRYRKSAWVIWTKRVLHLHRNAAVNFLVELEGRYILIN